MGSSNSKEKELNEDLERIRKERIATERIVRERAERQRKQAAESERQQKLAEARRQQRQAEEAERQRKQAEDAETILLKFNGEAAGVLAEAMMKSEGSSNTYYCGVHRRQSSVDSLRLRRSPYSYCGPKFGPQCADCHRYQQQGKGKSFDLEVRLNGTVLELKEKVLAELGMPSGSSFWLECAPRAQRRAHSLFAKEIVHLLEFEFSGYTLQPDEKTIREFDELCPVRCC
jgi:hypothetical protein